MSRRRAEPTIKSIWSPQDIYQILSKRHATKLWLWLIENPKINNINDIPFSKFSFSDDAINKIKSGYTMNTSKIVDIFESAREDTIKLLIELFDGHRVETVIMRHHKRTTVCLSSQVGCQMGCKFCATGTMGIIGDLHTNEIIEQLMFCDRITPARNVVFMGMGKQSFYYYPADISDSHLLAYLLLYR